MSEIKGELIDSKSVQGISQDYQLVKMQSEQIASMAQVRPRNNRQVIADLLEQVELSPAFASECVYAKPVGKNERGEMQYARGLSIRAAEAIASSWGYNSIEQSVEALDDDSVKIAVVFFDYQTGRRWSDAVIVSKFYRDRSGKMTRHSEDRFHNIIIKAEKSKLLREVIIRSVNPAIRMELQSKAESVIAKMLSDDTVEKIVQSFSGIGVGLAQLENLLGKPMKSGWTVDDRMILHQVFTAIREGETTVAEAFGNPVDRAAKRVVKTLSEAVEEVSN